jgi:hypothetical protein
VVDRTHSIIDGDMCERRAAARTVRLAVIEPSLDEDQSKRSSTKGWNGSTCRTWEAYGAVAGPTDARLKTRRSLHPSHPRSPTPVMVTASGPSLCTVSADLNSPPSRYRKRYAEKASPWGDVNRPREVAASGSTHVLPEPFMLSGWYRER